MWRCERKQACNGRLWTVGKNGAVVRVVGTHNHTGSPFKAGIIKFKTVIKEKAACSLEPASNILGAAVADVVDEVQQQGPSKEAIRKLVKRVRAKTIGVTTVPTDRASIEVPEHLANYVTGDKSEKFLLLDSGVGGVDR
ncbi:hypothetical protein AAVH_24089 [Aphelenchoides avenae]|nr:hypothetical protein AAVH_24089 [Aphelenchus avenae]